jgi:hypothetical protein
VREYLDELQQENPVEEPAHEQDRGRTDVSGHGTLLKIRCNIGSGSLPSVHPLDEQKL